MRKGSQQAWINGVLTADILDEGRAEGYVVLQAAETGEIRFRNVKIRPLKSSVAK